MNRLDVVLQRDLSIDALHLLQPLNITAESLAKEKLTTEELNSFLEFYWNLSADGPGLQRFILYLSFFILFLLWSK